MTDAAERLAEAVMADLDCADVFGHREELIASVRWHLAPAPVHDCAYRHLLREALEYANFGDAPLLKREIASVVG